VAAPDFVRVRTPDWLILLFAESQGYQAVVSRDRSQIELDEERVALASTRLSIVTWRRKIDDPISLWGHLLAYLPKIADLIRREGPQVITLPSIQLAADNRENTQAFARRTTSMEKTTFQELKARCTENMVSELRRRKLPDLERLIS
jgi:hypothetical protein